jgi:hypothetical protein
MFTAIDDLDMRRNGTRRHGERRRRVAIDNSRWQSAEGAARDLSLSTVAGANRSMSREEKPGGLTASWMISGMNEGAAS